MRLIYVFCFLLLLLSCTNKKITTEPNMASRKLTGELYTMGSATHFTDSCTFYFECDCCASDILLHPNKTFSLIDYCISDVSFSQGQYKKTNNSIIFYFSGKTYSKDYNWEYETDSSLSQYIFSDTILEPTKSIFTMKNCNNNIIFESKASVGNFILIKNKDKNAYKEARAYLKANKLI